MGGLLACLCTPYMHFLHRPEEGIDSPGTDSCEASRGCFESNPGSLQEQAASALTTEPSFQSSKVIFQESTPWAERWLSD